MQKISIPINNVMEKLLANNVRPEDKLAFRAMYEAKKKEFKKLDIDSLKVRPKVATCQD